MCHVICLQCCRDLGRRSCCQVLQGAKEKVAHVIVDWRDERVATSVVPADVHILSVEELLTVAVDEDDRC